MMKLPNIRTLNFISLFACAALILTAFYFQYVMGLEPCPLCMMQRIHIYILASFFLIAALHRPGITGQRIYAGLITFISLAGAGFASRQLWLQSLPADQVPACGPGFDYMMEVLPWSEIISVMMRGTGDCAEVQWTFLSFSIPGWTLVAFIVFALIGISQWRRRSS